MRTLLAACALLIMVAAATTATATEYFGIDQFSGGDVTLGLSLWDSDFIVGADYHVHRLDWVVTNNGTETWFDVKLVLPFTSLRVDGTVEAYDYDNANGEWHWTDTSDDFYLTPDDSAYTPAPAALSYMLMSDTDLPLSATVNGPVVTVLPTDSVPAWDIALTLGPSDTVTFTTYLKQETDSRVDGIWLQPYTVGTVPEPATVLLVGFGAAGLLLGRRRKR